LLFISGMTARNKEGGVTGVGDVAAQTHQVCQNLKAAVEAAGGSMDDIARVDVYVRNMEDFKAIHEVRAQYFTTTPPASTMVEVAKFVNKDYLIEISAIAVLD
jgi:enamine deaminase RidA (YjgF/YER057c/UK114 family)